eukprot:146114-Pelagomonas_calceolata.AAC.1
MQTVIWLKFRILNEGRNPWPKALALSSAPYTLGTRCHSWSKQDVFTKAGWHWNALQSPPALHFCFTPNHVGDGSSNGKQQTDVVQQLLEALRAGVATLMANPDAVQGGSAPIDPLMRLAQRPASQPGAVQGGSAPPARILQMVTTHVHAAHAVVLDAYQACSRPIACRSSISCAQHQAVVRALRIVVQVPAFLAQTPWGKLVRAPTCALWPAASSPFHIASVAACPHYWPHSQPTFQICCLNKEQSSRNGWHFSTEKLLLTLFLSCSSLSSGMAWQTLCQTEA